MEQSAPALPADVLQRIFSLSPPGEEPGRPLLSDAERLRCQLVCKAWRHALDARRWPLWGLGWHVPDAASEVPPDVLWAQRLRPAVRRLGFELGGTDGLAQRAWKNRWDSDKEDSEEDSEEDDEPLPFDSAAVQAVHAALLALQPTELRFLSLTLPHYLLDRFLPDLARFTVLRELRLYDLSDDEEDQGYAKLTPAMLRQLPQQLEYLAACSFCSVQLGPEAESAAAAADGEQQLRSGQEEPAQLLPCLTRLDFYNPGGVELNLPLPRLAELSVCSAWTCSGVGLAGPDLYLPQLTRLRIEEGPSVRLRCSAMPALARLSTYSIIAAVDSSAALQQLTHLCFSTEHPRYLRFMAPMLQGLAPTLRSLELYYGHDARAAAAAGTPHVTQLECRDLKCLLHLPAWPKLQALLLDGVRPTYIETEQLALLQAAPCLRRLAFSSSVRSNDEQQRMEELRQALPGCAVERYQPDF